MGVQKSRASSIHKYTRLFVRVKKKTHKLVINKQFKFFKFITKFAHLTNLLLEYLLWQKHSSLFEFFLQVSIAYSLIQLFKQSNFFFTLAYFLTLTVTVGISLAVYDADLATIILWIVYGGVIIVFFLYATMWSEAVKSNVFFYDYRLIFFFFYIYVFYMYINIIEEFKFRNKIMIFDFPCEYDLLTVDVYEELEMLGASFFFFSLFYLIICTIILVVSCFSVVVILLTLKKVKANAIFNFGVWIKDMYDNFFSTLVLKNQHFCTQEYENTYLQNSVSKVYKISVKFHRNKMHYRRI